MPRKKELKHGTKCGGLYEVEYTPEGPPFLRCSKCGHLIQDWIKWRQEYHLYHLDPAKWHSAKDHLMCLLGHFCAAYRAQYGVDFVFSLSERGLFGGPEVNILRRVYNVFSCNPLQVKALIDWYFSYKVQRRKKTITSLSFLATPEILNEFRQHQRKAAFLTRDRLLPNNLLAWLKTNTPGVLELATLRDFGDLKLLLTGCQRDLTLRRQPDLTKFIERLQAAGLINEQLELQNWKGD